MKKRTIALIVCGAVLGLFFWNYWKFHQKELQMEWRAVQYQNATNLSLLLWEFHETHQTYPEKLSDLVSHEMIGRAEFDRMKFQASPRAEFENWRYQKPDDTTLVAFVSPRLFYPWKGNRGQWIVGMKSGGAHIIGSAKKGGPPSWGVDDSLFRE